MSPSPSSPSEGSGTSALRVPLFIGFVCALALAAGALAWQVAGPPTNVPAVALLLLVAVAGWVGRDNPVGTRIRISFVSIVVLASIVITGPVGAALVGGGANLVGIRKMPRRARVFNTGMFAFIGAVGGLVYLGVGGRADVTSLHSASSLLLEVGLPLVAADVAQCLVNALLLAGIQYIVNAIPLRTRVWGLLATTGPAYIGYGVIGFLFVVLWIPAQVGWFSAILVLAPLFVARWAFAQYGDELQAHERTLRALVTAVETKEPHNAGHSERVAQLSEWMAEAMMLGHKEIEDIRTAGMLHDVGKVVMPTRLLGSRQAHTDDDHVTMAGHALAGVELVKDVDFLSGSVDGIAHHHERFDGRGYPDGLSGDSIPLAARIIAVADAFECLTSARSYRAAMSAEEALDVVRHQAASQFDPQVVELLVKALSRHEWTGTDRTPDELASAGVALDHDEPQVSDHIAFSDRLRTRITGRAAGLHHATGEVR
ncbi:HD-GYP domain-containing protein [Pedococcus bigeumensis]|jgi:putative nucleotidyltransferase with HDIG domain|uniref:HD-GYP domain-containing protein n=1 Tax=Pedococcus bigeumensis TaxID=433644 RepID=UPI002FE8B869